MTREEINAWFLRVCQECLGECNELESPGASFGAGMALGVIAKNLYLLEDADKLD